MSLKIPTSIKKKIIKLKKKKRERDKQKIFSIIFKIFSLFNPFYIFNVVFPFLALYLA
jgi:hypothetical protein